MELANRRYKSYDTWKNMRQRCTNPNRPDYSRYGGRGIKMCSRWQDSFKNFLNDMGEKPGPDYSIDRIDNDGGYTPENCRWVGLEEQANNKRCNVLVDIDGEVKTLAQWVSETNLKYRTVWQRVNGYGWSFKKAISTPARERG